MMSRVLKIMSVAVVLFLAYMWISVLTKSCNREKTEKVNDKTAREGGDEFTEDEFFSEEGDTVTTKDPVDYNEIDATIEKTVDAKSDKPNSAGEAEESVAAEESSDKKSESKPTSDNGNKPVLKPKVPATKVAPTEEPKEKQNPEKTVKQSTNDASQPSGGSSGVYVVVAGNYLVEENANSMLQKLKKNGFKNAEKVVFDLSEFFTVIAGRYESQQAAGKAISNLKSKGIDAYLQRKK